MRGGALERGSGQVWGLHSGEEWVGPTSQGSVGGEEPLWAEGCAVKGFDSKVLGRSGISREENGGGW